MANVNQSIVRLYQTYKNILWQIQLYLILENIEIGLLIQSEIIPPRVPSKYNPLAGSSCINLLKELTTQKKDRCISKILVIMNDLNCVLLDTYICADHNLRRTEKVDKKFREKLDFEDKKLKKN